MLVCKRGEKMSESEERRLAIQGDQIKIAPEKMREGPVNKMCETLESYSFSCKGTELAEILLEASKLLSGLLAMGVQHTIRISDQNQKINGLNDEARDMKELLSLVECEVCSDCDKWHQSELMTLGDDGTRRCEDCHYDWQTENDSLPAHCDLCEGGVEHTCRKGR